MQRCVLCETLLTPEARSREHVIPASFGGRRCTSKALCQQCNSKTGHAWDAELERQLRPISVLVFPHDHTCGRKQHRIANAEGNRLLPKAGIRGGAEGPQIRINKESSRREIPIPGMSRQTVQEIRRPVKAGGLLAAQEEELIRSIEWEETTTRADFRDVGGVGGVPGISWGWMTWVQLRNSPYEPSGYTSSSDSRTHCCRFRSYVRLRRSRIPRSLRRPSR